MKIVMITKLIHPTQSPRVFRVLELAIELSGRGHEVIIYANLGKYDYSKFQRKYNIKIRGINNMIFDVQNSDGIYSGNYFNRGLRKFFGKWLDFPDIEFLWKVPKIIKKETNADLLLTFAVPHSIHWGTALYRKKYQDNFPKVWIADCGDPFMGNRFKNPPFYFAYLERTFCNQADFITIPIESARIAYYPEFQSKIHIIPQGFKFKITKNSTQPINDFTTFLYAGNFYPPARDPRPFLEYLGSVNRPFRFIIHTQHQELILPFKVLLGQKLEIREFIPRSELLRKMKKMDFLINFDNGTNVHSPSKLIDYLIAERPILSIGSNQLDFKIIDEFLRGDYSHRLIINDTNQYKIENVTDKFISLFSSKVSSTS